MSASAAAEEVDHRRQVMTLVATGLGLFMIFLDATIVNVALPDIQSHFDVGEAGVQWVVAAYSLTMGMFIMTSASIADARGRRRVYLGGIGLFCVASVLCGLAWDITVLNVARGLQGVGAATVNVASLSLVSAAYPEPAAKQRAIGLWTGIAAVGLAVGPTLGGVLTESLGWRSIFLVNVLLGVVVVLLTLAFVAESRDPVARRFDLPGQLLFIVGVGALTYGLIQGSQFGWSSPLTLGLLGGAVAVLAVFVRTELRSRSPMMDVRVFGDPVYTTAIVTIFATLFGVYGMFLVITQYFQNVQGYSPERAGVLMLAYTVPTVICAPLAGQLAARVGGRRPTLVGLAALALGFSVLAAAIGGPLPFVLVGLALAGAAAGFAVSPATGIAMSSIPPERSGMASGIMSAQRALGSTAGFAIMGTILALVVSMQLPGDLETLVPDATERAEVVEQVTQAANPQAVAAAIGPGRPLAESDDSEKGALAAAADGAFVAGMRAAFLVALVLALAALVAGWRVFPKGRATTDEQVEGEVEQLEREEGGPSRPTTSG
ncbi:MAG: MFS transporter [Acidimicrobiia bacterium]|nr:MFS transporter [Acidimicrobiia bacterium]